RRARRICRVAGGSGRCSDGSLVLAFGPIDWVPLHYRQSIYRVWIEADTLVKMERQNARSAYDPFIVVSDWQAPVTGRLLTPRPAACGRCPLTTWLLVQIAAERAGQTTANA